MRSSHADQFCLRVLIRFHLILSRPSLQDVNSPTSPHMTDAVGPSINCVSCVWSFAVCPCLSYTRSDSTLCSVHLLLHGKGPALEMA